MTIYLDNAATSFPKPDCVYDAVDNYMRHQGAAFGRSQYSSAESADAMVLQCRQRLATILDAAAADSIALTFNCTDSLNLLLKSVLRNGDHVVTTTLEHNSVLRPLKQLQAERNIEVTHVPPNDRGEVTADAVQSALKDSTKLVAILHASNVTGIIQPIADIAALVQNHSAMLLVDAAQTIGHLPFSVRDLSIDLLAAAGHKGLCGPLGTGLIYVRPGCETDLRPVRCGGTGSRSESIDHPTTMPTLFEAGNFNMPGIAGLNAAAGWTLENDRDESLSTCRNHVQRLQHELAEIAGVEVVHAKVPAANKVGIVSFRIPGTDSRELAVLLDQAFQIQSRAGLHCAPLAHAEEVIAAGGTLRLSPGHFTSDADIDAAINAVRQLAEQFI